MTKPERLLLMATATAILRMAIWGQNTGLDNATKERLRKAIDAVERHPKPDAE
jgi:hypothetical protein